MERFNAESESDRSDEGQAKGYKPMFEYCEVSSAVLGGAREASDADEDGALRNAVVLKMLKVGQFVDGKGRFVERENNPPGEDRQRDQ